jgi:hypothetical protein
LLNFYLLSSKSRWIFLVLAHSPDQMLMGPLSSVTLEEAPSPTLHLEFLEADTSLSLQMLRI